MPPKKLKIPKEGDIPHSQSEEKQKKQEKREKQEKQEPESCTVCLDDYTAVIRKKVVCKYCKKDACAKCIERYLLERIEDAHCLHCRVNYDDTCLQEICTKTYLQDKYTKHRQEVLVNRERANLPGLQDQAVAERRKRERQRRLQELAQELNALRESRDALLVEYNEAYANYHAIRRTSPQDVVDQLYQRLKEAQKKSDAHRLLMNNKEIEYTQVYREMRNGDAEEEEKEGENGSAAATGEKKKFIRRCTRDGCQGFLSTAWKCALCEHYSCNKCFTPRGEKPDDPHECRKEDVETADLLRKDSKPCPNCGVFITKSEGCQQMFCVSCQTPFDWGTGKVITSGVIHNPHYFEWLRRNGHTNTRNPADVPCGGYPAAWELRRVPRDFHETLKSRCPGTYPPHLDRKFFEFHRLCMEIQDVSTRNWQTHLTQDAGNRINVAFLLGDYDEKRWGQLLAQLERKRKRDREVQEVFAAFRMVAVELINRFQNYRDPVYGAITTAPAEVVAELLLPIYTESAALIDMINDAFRQISIRHRYAVPVISMSVSSHNHHMRYDILHRRYGEKDVMDAGSTASSRVEAERAHMVAAVATAAAAAAIERPPTPEILAGDIPLEPSEEDADEVDDAESRAHAERFFQDLQQALLDSLTQ